MQTSLEEEKGWEARDTLLATAQAVNMEEINRRSFPREFRLNTGLAV